MNVWANTLSEGDYITHNGHKYLVLHSQSFANGRSIKLFVQHLDSITPTLLYFNYSDYVWKDHHE